MTGTVVARIAIVEDDPDIRFLLKYMLQHEGYELLEAADGQEALTMIQTQDPPDVLLLDFMVPYYDGLHLLAYVRKHARWKDVPIIMLSSNAIEANVQKALKLGANDYLKKPFDPSEVLARIRRLRNPEHVSESPNNIYA